MFPVFCCQTVPKFLNDRTHLHQLENRSLRRVNAFEGGPQDLGNLTRFSGKSTDDNFSLNDQVTAVRDMLYNTHEDFLDAGSLTQAGLPSGSQAG